MAGDFGAGVLESFYCLEAKLGLSDAGIEMERWIVVVGCVFEQSVRMYMNGA